MRCGCAWIMFSFRDLTYRMLWRYLLVPLLFVGRHTTLGDDDSYTPLYGCNNMSIPDYPGYYVQFEGDGTDWTIQECPDKVDFNAHDCVCQSDVKVFTKAPTSTPPPTTTERTTTTTPFTTPGTMTTVFTKATTSTPPPTTTEITTTTTTPFTTTTPVTMTTATTTLTTTTSETTTTTTTAKTAIKPRSTTPIFRTTRPYPTTISTNVPIVPSPKHKFTHVESLPETTTTTTTTTTPQTGHELKSNTRETVCEGCRFDGGVGFNNHPTDCDKYIMCYVHGYYGNLTGHVRQCGIGNYWDQDLLTCRNSATVACYKEKCLQNSLVDSYRFEGDCRGYWRCEYGISIGYCCPKGQGYYEGEGCIPDPSCDTPCDNVDGPRDCDKIAMIGDPGKFQQHLVGHGYIDMLCAGGTVFNETICGCQTDTRPNIQPRACRKEMDLEFNSGITDTSGNRVHIQAENVTIDNGSACFDGNSVLVIPRFSNVEIGRHLEVRIRYKLDDGYASKNSSLQALLFNGDCGLDYSIIVAAGLRSSYFGLGSNNGRYKSIQMRHDLQYGGWNDAVYSLHSNVMKSDVNNITKTRTILGGIGRSKCGLTIGWGTGYDSFHGCINKISISFCPP